MNEDKQTKTPSLGSLENEYKSLEALRSYVVTAVEEIARLRMENASLQKRLQALQLESDAAADGLQLKMERNPEVLREKINTFIDTIDLYLTNYSDSLPS